MGKDDIRISINGLTELDRLELEKTIGKKLAITTQRTPDGHLGEPGSMTATITLGIAALEVVGGALALWLAKDRRKSLLKDEIEIQTPNGTIRRTLVIRSETSDAIKADVVKQLTEMVSLAGSGRSQESRGA